MTYTGHKDIKINGQTLVERIKPNLRQSAAIYGVPIPSDAQIGLVVSEIKDHTLIMHASDYDIGKLWPNQNEVTDFYPIQSSIGRYLRDAGTAAMELANLNPDHSKHTLGCDTDVTTNIDTMLDDLIEDAIEFGHRDYTGMPRSKDERSADYNKLVGLKGSIKDLIAREVAESIEQYDKANHIGYPYEEGEVTPNYIIGKRIRKVGVNWVFMMTCRHCGSEFERRTNKLKVAHLGCPSWVIGIKKSKEIK